MALKATIAQLIDSNLDVPLLPKESKVAPKKLEQLRRHFVAKTGDLFNPDNDQNDDTILIQKMEQSWSGQFYAHCMTLDGDEDTVNQWGPYRLIGAAELCDFSAPEDEDKAFGWMEREEPEDVDELFARWDSLDEVNWTHLKALAEIQDSRLQNVLSDIDTFEAEGNVKMLAQVAYFLRRMSFASMLRSKGKVVDSNGKKVDATGFTYIRYATAMNRVTNAVAKLNGVEPSQMGKPFGVMKIREMPKTEELDKNGDVLDHGCRVGEFMAESVPTENWEPRIEDRWISAKYVATPAGIQTYRDPEFLFGSAALAYIV